MAPDGQTVVVLERPCHPDTTAWQQPDDALRAEAVSLLADHGLVARDEVVASTHHEVPFAYPILEVGAAEKAGRLKQYLDRFDNLHRLGRSADFAYTHTHDLYSDARTLTQSLAARTPPAA